MSDARQATRLIQSEILRLRVLGHWVEAVVVSPEMQKALAEANIGSWRDGPGAYSLSNLKVVVEPVKGGWALRVRDPESHSVSWRPRLISTTPGGGSTLHDRSQEGP